MSNYVMRTTAFILQYHLHRWCYIKRKNNINIKQINNYIKRKVITIKCGRSSRTIIYEVFSNFLLWNPSKWNNLGFSFTNEWTMFIAAGHQPAADHILERFEIFRSMVPWFDGSINLWLQRCAVSGFFKQVLSCRACFSLRSNPPFCFALM